MLRRKVSIALAITAGFLVTFWSAVPANAEDIRVCDSYGNCYIQVGTPGSPGTPGGGGGNTGGGGPMVCHSPVKPDVVIPCSDQRGWYDGQGCYWRLLDPQPPVGAPGWQGHLPSEGAVYHATCPFGGSWMGRAGDVFLAAPPPGFGGLPSPAVLAAQAISQIPIRGAEIGTAPNAAGRGLVGVPVWLWTAKNANTWGPLTATASVPGLTVTAEANATSIEWRMGDGHSVLCQNPGTLYDQSYGGQSSPSCSYLYATPSRNQPGGKFQITAVTHWHVTWAGGGQTGAVDVTRQSTSTITIDELQVVAR